MKPFWETIVFWFVVMPTSLVAVAFLLGMIANALDQEARAKTSDGAPPLSRRTDMVAA